jgi:hypothetical protein
VNGAPHIPQEDLALYSMQALTPAEQSQIAAHLAECADCKSALADIYAENALLALTVDPQPLPSSLRQRFMARVANTPQETAAEKAAALRRSADLAHSRRKSGGAMAWLGWVTALTALAVAVYLGHTIQRLGQQLNKDRSDIAMLSAQAARAEELTDALTSPAAKQVTLTETKKPAEPVGHATYLPNKGALIFVADNLRPLEPNKTYELWLIPANGKAPMPAGLFRPDASGSASVVLPELPQGVEAKGFGVTIEDAQGSPTPTLPIVMSGS